MFYVFKTTQQEIQQIENAKRRSFHWIGTYDFSSRSLRHVTLSRRYLNMSINIKNIHTSDWSCAIVNRDRKTTWKSREIVKVNLERCTTLAIYKNDAFRCDIFAVLFVFPTRFINLFTSQLFFLSKKLDNTVNLVMVGFSPFSQPVSLSDTRGEIAFGFMKHVLYAAPHCARILY
jgi:hypothetical protein